MHFNFQITKKKKKNDVSDFLFSEHANVHSPFSNPYTPFSSGVKHHTHMKMHGISIGCIINKRITNLILLFICVISSVV